MSDRPRDAPGDVVGGERPKVVYVMGAGRSGSTILGVALGNSDGVFFAGELDRWLVRGARPSVQREAARRFWGNVLAETGEEPQLRGGITTCLERSSVLFDPRKWRRRVLLRPSYLRASERLYRATARVSGAAILIDTSHYPLRARELRAIEGIDLHLLYLVRDPRGVVSSLGRRDVRERTFGTFRANAYLWLTQAVATFVFLSQPRERRLLVRFEDFTADPGLVLGEILRFAGSAAAPAELGPLATGTPFHGNRLIEAESVTLERPEAKAASGSRLTWLIQLPWTVIAGLLRPSARGR